MVARRHLIWSLSALLAALVLAGATSRESAPRGMPPATSGSSAVERADYAVRPAGITPSWTGDVFARIAREEYETSWGDRGWQAPNRAQNLRTYFENGAVAIVPRTGEAGWSLGWRTTGWGREGRLVDVTGEAPPPRPDGPKVTYARTGLVEWYQNREAGLEQGFVLTERPEASGPVRIEGELDGGLRAEAVPGEEAIDFLNEAGARVLRYGGLHVVDSAGRDVPSHLVLETEKIAIVLDDSGATYPVTVDPIVTSPSWTAESNQSGACLGSSVGTAGDVNGDGYSDIIVGAAYYDNGDNDEGKVFVYLGSSAGAALSPAWTAEGNQFNAQFGSSVGTAGDVNGDGHSDVIVGAPFYDSGEADEGRAFVYLGTDTGLMASPAWTAGGDQASARFGFSVAFAGDVNGDGYSDVIVGANWYDNGETNEGQAFVFHGSPGGLSATPNWTAQSNQGYSYLGGSVSTAGDVNGDGYSDVIVGAPMYTNGQGVEGRAFVYLGSNQGLAVSAVWTAESDQANAYFGCRVGAAGDVNGDGYADVIVGAYGYDHGETDEGGAFLFLGASDGLGATPAWTTEGDQAGAALGYAAATAGDVNGDGFADVVVGAYGYDGGHTDEGKASVYCGSSAGVAADPIWTSEGSQTTAWYGWSAGTAGDVNGDGYSDLLVGSFYYDNGETDEGRAHLYHGSAAGLAPAAGWTAEGNQSVPFFGFSLGTAGDVNGDGYSDIIVGAHKYDNGQTDEGRAFVYQGSAGGPSLTPNWTGEADQVSAEYGTSVGTAGDVNGDGYSDIIVGAPYFDNGETNEGRALVYLGSSGGLSTSPAWTVEGNQAGAFFGYSVATAGDVNGDGYSDVVVGNPFYDHGETNEGLVAVYLGSPSGPATGPSWTAEADQANANFGNSVATAGDVNGDSFSDLVFGARNYSHNQNGEGRAYVYHGSAAGLASSPAWYDESNQVAALFGCSVGTAGDVNGDGYSDVIVGSYFYSWLGVEEGLASVYHGSASGLSEDPYWTVYGTQDYERFGICVGTAGDVNGDGFSDVAVGAPDFSNGETGEGRVCVYQGSPSGLPPTATWTAEGGQVGAQLGGCVATAGDVNGDGYCDLLAGAVGYDNGQSDEGAVFAYYGNAGDGLHRIARQAVADDSRPIAPLGLAGSPSYDGFLLKTLGRSAAGRVKVRLQFEVKPLGTPFNGGGIVTGPEVDSGAPAGGGSAVALSGTVSGLAPATQYRWRLRALSDSPYFPRSPWFSIPCNSVTEADVRIGSTVIGVADEEVTERALLFRGAAPNPFAALTALSYSLPERGHMRLAVYDVTGRRIAVLRDGVEDAGAHRATWDGRDTLGMRVPSGVYYAQLRYQGRIESRKIVLTR